MEAGCVAAPATSEQAQVGTRRAPGQSMLLLSRLKLQPFSMVHFCATLDSRSSTVTSVANGALSW